MRKQVAFLGYLHIKEGPVDGFCERCQKNGKQTKHAQLAFIHDY